ncbi:chorismate mutase [Streptomyces sp. MMS24-I31]|uniref:chorismate mutase n=1 Tax=Streptomyces sp. MMS24-I31 TaxID=3351563 RepID=UPI003896D0EE
MRFVSRARNVLLAGQVAAVVALAAAPAVAAPGVSTPAVAGPRAMQGATASLRDGQLLEPVVSLAAARALMADKVAAAKYGTGTPIDDPVREQQVLDSMAGRGQAMGLDPADVRRVFRDQIEANKLVQRQLFRLWDTGVLPPPTDRPSLAEIRPVIDRLNGDLLAALADAGSVRTTPGCWANLAWSWQAVVREQHLNALHTVALARAVPSLCMPGRAPGQAAGRSPQALGQQ